MDSVNFSPDNQWLATGDDGGILRLWSVTNLKSKPEYEFSIHDDWVDYMSFDLDGRWLASLGHDGTVALLDMSKLQGGAKPHILRGHDGPVWDLSFSSDKHWLATNGDDGTVRLWNLDNPDNISSIAMQGFQGTSLSLPWFSADSRFLMTVGSDGAWQLWHMKQDDLMQIACQTAGRNMTEEEWNTHMPEGTDRRVTCDEFPLAPAETSILPQPTPQTTPIPQASNQTCSISSDVSVNITFQNNSDQAVDVYWINFDCQPVLYGSLAPGDSYQQQTYITHVWQFINPKTNNVLKEFVAEKDGEVVTIP